MAKTLYLLRHGKSSWGDSSLADIDRPLNKRGRKAAKRMGKELARRGWLPELVLCSTATRTRETYQRFSKGMENSAPGTAPEAALDERLYLAAVGTLLDRAQALDDRFASALMLGHNAGLQEFAVALSAGGEIRDKIAAKFPTCALAVIGFDSDHWRDLAWGEGRLEAALYPRELD